VPTLGFSNTSNLRFCNILVRRYRTEAIINSSPVGMTHMDVIAFAGKAQAPLGT
jgi:hypothetical protein